MSDSHSASPANEAAIVSAKNLNDSSRRFTWQRWPAWLFPIIAFCLACFELSDFDIWYHLRTGELIPRLGVPQKDWYSFRSAEEDWIDVHWGFQRIVAEIYTRWESAGLVLMKSVLATLVLAISLTAYRREWPTFVLIVVWTPALLLMSSRFYERPEMFTMLFTAIYLSVLFHAESHPKWLWLLPIIQVAWANIQGLFVFGPILLGMYWMEAVLRVDRVRGLFRHLIPVTSLVFAACIASPYTWRNLLLVLQISQTATTSLYRDSIAELRSVPAVIREGGATDPFVILLAICMLLAAAGLITAFPIIIRERRLFRVLPLFGFGYVGLQAIRNGNHCALVLATVTCWNLGSLRWKHRPAWLGFGAQSLWMLALLLLVVTERWNLIASPTRQIGLGERPNYYAREALELAGRQGMPIRALVMHNGHAALFEYLNFSPESKRQTFVDARLEVHSQQTYKLYLDLTQSFRDEQGLWVHLLRQDGVDLVAADSDQYPEAQATLFAHPEWMCVWYDEVMAIFLRKTVPLPEGVQRWSVRDALFAKPDADLLNLGPTQEPKWIWRPPVGYRRGKDDLLAVRSGAVWDRISRRSTASPEMVRSWNLFSMQAARRAIVRRPWALDGWRAMGYAAIGAMPASMALDQPMSVPDLAMFSLATTSLRNVIELSPNDFYANFWLGQIYQAMGAYDLAEASLERVATLTPRDRQQVKMLAHDGQLRSLLADVRLKQNALDNNLTSTSDIFQLVRAGKIGLALQANPSELKGKRKLAELHLVFGDAERAKKIFADIGWGEFGNALGYWTTGDWQATKTALNAVVDSKSDIADAKWILALLAIMTGERVKALDHIEQGLAASPSAYVEQRLKQLREIALPTAE